MHKIDSVHVKIKTLLLEKGWTQKQLAEKAGLREATISEMANNQRSTLNKEQLCIIANVFELQSIDELLEFIYSD